MATTETGYDVISIGERAAEGADDRVYVRLRADLDIGAFGASASHQKKAGELVVTEHDEVGPASDGHEELYVVVQGRATFTVGGDEIDAPEGTVVFVRNPAAKRKAVAETDGTIVLAVGGRRGEPYRLAPGPALREFFRLHADKDYEGAMEVCREALETYPGNAFILYNIACLENLQGRPADALATLSTSVERWPAYKDTAREDDDFASLRDDARFAELIA
jgi:tetratricopeptide (TPR) repeat protein